MGDFVKMPSHHKGDASTYRPTAGTICLISGPHCDDENGYTYGEFEVLWTDDLFILYRKSGCWPVLNKWEHIRSKPLGEVASSQPTESDGCAECRHTYCMSGEVCKACGDVAMQGWKGGRQPTDGGVRNG